MPLFNSLYPSYYNTMVRQPNYSAMYPQQPQQQASQQPGSTSTDPFVKQIEDLYSQFGLKDTGRGTGLTDEAYWTQDALKNAGGDTNYVYNRLRDDLMGKGMDSPGNQSNNGQMNSMMPNNPQNMRDQAFAWRRNWAARGMQKPIYNSTMGYGYVPPSGTNYTGNSSSLGSGMNSLMPSGYKVNAY